METITIPAAEYAKLLCAAQDLERLRKYLVDKKWVGIKHEELALIITLFDLEPKKEGN